MRQTESADEGRKHAKKSLLMPCSLPVILIGYIMNFFVDTLTFPFRGGGWVTWLMGAGFLGFSYLAELAPLVGLLVSLAISAFLVATFFDITRSSATGSGDATAFPDITNLWEDLVVPYFSMVAAALVSFGPALALAAFVSLPETAVVLLLFLCGFYFLMALLAVAISGNVLTVSPHIVLPALLRAGWKFWVGALAVAVVWAVIGDLLPVVLNLENLFVYGGIQALVQMMALMMMGRLLGLVYWDREEVFGWL